MKRCAGALIALLVMVGLMAGMSGPATATGGGGHHYYYKVSCEGVKGKRPNHDSVDSNIRVKNKVTGETRNFNYHGPDHDYSKSFNYTLAMYGVPSSWTYIEILWVQVNGFNYHWDDGLVCGEPPVEEPPVVEPPKPEPPTVIVNPPPPTVVVVTPPPATPKPPKAPKPPKVKLVVPHITVIDECRCKDDVVKVRVKGVVFKSVRQDKNVFTIRLIAGPKVLLPKDYRHPSKGWAKRVKYVVKTTNTKCPCPPGKQCKPKPKPKPVCPARCP